MVVLKWCLLCDTEGEERKKERKKEKRRWGSSYFDSYSKRFFEKSIEEVVLWWKNRGGIYCSEFFIFGGEDLNMKKEEGGDEY
jgi:hypothetical protein